MEKINGRSIHDTNALEAQRIEGAFFFSRRLFEWDMWMNMALDLRHAVDIKLKRLLLTERFF